MPSTRSNRTPGPRAQIRAQRGNDDRYWLLVFRIRLLVFRIRLLIIRFRLLIVRFRLPVIRIRLLVFRIRLLIVRFRLLIIRFRLLIIRFRLLIVRFRLLIVRFRLLIVRFRLLIVRFRLLAFRLRSRRQIRSSVFRDNWYVNRFSDEGGKQPGVSFEQIPFAIGGLANDRHFVVGKDTVHPLEFNAGAGTQIRVESDNSLDSCKLNRRRGCGRVRLGRLLTGFW